MTELPFSDGFVDHNCFLGKGFKIAHLNILSVRNKIDELRLFLHHNDFDILCLSETWLTSNIDNNEVYINGYDICRLDRKGTQGRGVLCYIKSTIV